MEHTPHNIFDMARSIYPTENHLKAQLLNVLRRARRISSSTIIANELPLGTTGVRADLALYSKCLTGVEIKSARDSLKRLERQLSTYRTHFDRTILVLDSKHWGDVLTLDISGIELWIATGMALRRVQSGIVIQQTENQDALLSQNLKKLSRTREIKNGNIEISFKRAFKSRFENTSRAFWSATNDRAIVADDLTLLSRFIDVREQSGEMRKKIRRAKKDWLDEIVQSIQSSSVSKKDASSS